MYPEIEAFDHWLVSQYPTSSTRVHYHSDLVLFFFDSGFLNRINGCKRTRFHSVLLYNNYMATPTQNLSVAQLDQYRRTALRRQSTRVLKVKARMDRGWELARKAAKILRERYHAERVAVFGSLLHETRFTPWSDVDIAAWGIPADQTLRALGAVMDLDSSLEINLVDVNTCTPSLLKAIEQEAVDV